MNVHFSSKTNEWTTPINFYNELNKEFNFTLDPCCTKENALCQKYYTKEDNGLVKDWSNEIVFMNPPYDRNLHTWIRKAYLESLNNAIVVCLIPARTETQYWHDFIFPYALKILFIKGRLRFGGSKHNAPFPSAIIVFEKRKIPTIQIIKAEKISWE